MEEFREYFERWSKEGEIRDNSIRGKSGGKGKIVIRSWRNEELSNMNIYTCFDKLLLNILV